jgi:hypothetical protein
MGCVAGSEFWGRLIGLSREEKFVAGENRAPKGRRKAKAKAAAGHPNVARIGDASHKNVRATGESPKAEAKQKNYSGAPVRKLWFVRKAIRRCMAEVDKPESQAKSVVAELIRLIALERELAEETEAIREIKVTWVDPSETAPSKSA